MVNLPNYYYCYFEKDVDWRRACRCTVTASFDVRVFFLTSYDAFTTTLKQETADDPALLTEVYASCLSVLFVNIGPQLASSMDQRYCKLLRDQVLGGKPR